MSGMSVLGDKAKCPQHPHGCACCPHSQECIGPSISASTNVYINGKQAMRQGDVGVHAACCGPNTWIVTEASGLCFINGASAVRIGDTTVHCGTVQGKMVDGSGNVYDHSPKIMGKPMGISPDVLQLAAAIGEQIGQLVQQGCGMNIAALQNELIGWATTGSDAALKLLILPKIKMKNGKVIYTGSHKLKKWAGVNPFRTWENPKKILGPTKDWAKPSIKGAGGALTILQLGSDGYYYYHETGGDIGRTVLKTGVSSGTSILGSVAGGMGAGALAGTVCGPGAPVCSTVLGIAGGVAGGITGGFFGKELADLF